MGKTYYHQIMDCSNENTEGCDKIIFGCIHPDIYDRNFNSLKEFKEYLYDIHLIIGISYTLKKILKIYEQRELYDHCIVLKEVIDSIAWHREQIKNNKKK